MKAAPEAFPPPFSTYAGTDAGEEAALDDEELAARAERAERRLEGVLEQLKERGQRVAASVRGTALPVRIAGAALVAGVAAVLLVGAIGSVVRRRRSAPRRRSLRAAVGRSLAQEIGARMLVGAAGVLGARLASEVVFPAIARRLAEDGAEPARRPTKRRRPRTSDDDGP